MLPPQPIFPFRVDKGCELNLYKTSSSLERDRVAELVVVDAVDVIVAMAEVLTGSAGGAGEEDKNPPKMDRRGVSVTTMVFALGLALCLCCRVMAEEERKREKLVGDERVTPSNKLNKVRFKDDPCCHITITITIL